MKENWERMKPARLLSVQEIEEMLQAFMPGKSLKSTEVLGGGFSNSNYKLQIDSLDHPLVLRVCNQNICQVEDALHGRLHKHMPVPEIYYSECNGEKSFAVMEWKEGIQLKGVMYSGDVKPIRQSAFSAGYWLSEIRKHMFPRSGFFNGALDINEPLKIKPDTFHTLMEQFLIDGHTSHWLGSELTSKLWDFIRTNKHLLEDIDPAPALVHSDYNGLNILVSEDNSQVTGILDWEFAFAGPVYVDIGNMLRYENIPHFAEFEHAFIEGLQSGGIVLHDEWKKVAKLVDLIALCSLLNNRHGGINRVRDIKQLITQTMENWGGY
ncbi:aminoglycoside phosphotransferase (APT) family kinase protein [Scopulibacillus darangshiensis]|uniref:Aminoglycoside phosphotransferase (APT) family kinase protein n=1 Tax=Scopulibacillus darangshiensis TaxID=442528 RepID=A0A4R2NU43_9BACL|nr:aminoglycoside phosphotransferase family protein [Scopulibacillus darangshiensis]TCP25599.1 aminoglycoside phosphotransferase (APT) family kinase protein [Scopulibacillus darangshiensis]